LDSKTNGEYYFKHVQFHFSHRTTYNLWKKTKVETLSAVCTKNQNSKTVIKTIIDGGHRKGLKAKHTICVGLSSILMQVKTLLITLS
jgi:hypothetical protein